MARANDSLHPDDQIGPTSIDDEHQLNSRPVSLGAHCRLRETADTDLAQNFAVSEFVVLQDGARVLLHDDRGFTLGSTHAHGYRVSRAQLVAQVLSTVLPDDDDSPDEHPWSELVEQARAAGLEVNESQLRQLPYAVVLTDRVEEWLVVGRPGS